MKSSKFYFIFLSVFCCCFSLSLYGLAGLGGFMSSMKGIGSSVKQMGQGMAESFGMNPPGYENTFCVFNNSESSASVEARRIKKIQGVMFMKSAIKEITLDPATNTGTTFNGIGLYFETVLRCNGQEVLTNPVMSLFKKHDTEMHYYTIYEDSNGPGGEYLGTGKITSDLFLGQLYNMTSKKQQVTFKYAGQVFTTEIDPSSFNILSQEQDIPNCIRPKKGVTYLDCGNAGAITVASEGIAIAPPSADPSTSSTTGAAASSSAPPSAMQYHYELFSDGTDIKVGTSSMSVTKSSTMGYDQATTPRIRNITPVRCLIWHKAADQIQATPGFVPVDMNTRTTWVAYASDWWGNATEKVGTIPNQTPKTTGKGFSLSALSNNIVMAPIAPGQAIQMYIMRPLVDNPNKLTEKELLQTNALTKDPKTAKLTAEADSVLGAVPGYNKLDLYQSIKDNAPKTAKTNLYIVSLNTTDQTKAKTFLTNLISGKISLPPTPDITATNTVLTEQIKSTLLSAQLTETLGELQDADSGVSGIVLAHDIFCPYGAGVGPYYYTVSSPQALIAPTNSVLYSYLSKDAVKTQDQVDAITNTVGAWIQGAQKYGLESPFTGADGKSTTIKQLVTTFLQKNGSNQLFAPASTSSTTPSTTPATPTFSQAGENALNMILYGPQGISKAPVLWAAGVNNTVYTGNKSPATVDPTTKKSTGEWSPTKTLTLSGQPAVDPVTPPKTSTDSSTASSSSSSTTTTT